MRVARPGEQTQALRTTEVFRWCGDNIRQEPERVSCPLWASGYPSFGTPYDRQLTEKRYRPCSCYRSLGDTYTFPYHLATGTFWWYRPWTTHQNPALQWDSKISLIEKLPFVLCLYVIRPAVIFWERLTTPCFHLCPRLRSICPEGMVCRQA